jgi:hypothetical protein
VPSLPSDDSYHDANQRSEEYDNGDGVAVDRHRRLPTPNNGGDEQEPGYQLDGR